MATDDADAIICEFFSALQELSELRRKYDAASSEGYVNLAKTRYSGGTNAVGQVQYPSEIAPTLLVDVEHKEVTADATPLSFTLAAGTPESRSHDDHMTSSDDHVTSELRQRHAKAASDLERKEKVQSTKENNPLLWFSALPPTSLRLSQQQFKQGLEILVSMATVQSNIEVLRGRYRKSIAKATPTTKHQVDSCVETVGQLQD